MAHHASKRGQAIAEAAAQLIGSPFRLNGRNPRFGLDCVGLVHCALEAAGLRPASCKGYQLRNYSIEPFLKSAEASGLAKSSGPVEPGDIVLVIPGPAQHHLLVAEGGGRFIHAHAGLRKVVRSTPPIPWEIVSAWCAAPEGLKEF